MSPETGQDRTLVEVAEGVYACLQPDRGLGWSNSGLVAGADGTGLAVDTFWDLPRTREAIRLYQTVLGEPPDRLVNTHHNGDHCWGNQLYAELGTQIIGHRECAARLAADASPELLQSLAEGADDAPPQLRGFARALAQFDFSGIRLTPPDTVMDDELDFDVGGTQVRVTYVGPAHTAGDVIVHVPDRGVVFTGDILFHECTPIGWEGTNDRWIEALRTIEALEPQVVVPGHGPLATVDGVRAMREYLAYVFDEARGHYDAGRSVLEACKAIDLGPYAAWTEPERLAMNVARAFREFRGGSWDEAVELGAVAPDIAALRAHYASA
jgi:glyoxylase-like metal-dependent hydrolase (beta-lactamase superfamily II)